MSEGNLRRYPRNMQGVLQMAVEAGSADGGAGSGPEMQPMDEERRQWLNGALSSMVVDEARVVRDHIKMLDDDRCAEDEKEEVLEQITDMCDRIDMAKDFHKLGGYEVLPKVLAHESSEIRWRGCDLIATLVQNNPYCQDAAMEMNLLDKLLHLMDKDETNMVRIKALYAISCLCREYDRGLDTFIEKDGLSCLIRALQSSVEKLQTKAAFFLQALCTTKPGVRDLLCDVGMIEQLVGSLQKEHGCIHEHLMMALLSICRDEPRAIQECKREEFQLKALLKERITFLEGKDEFLEEKEYAEQLLQVCFKSQNRGQDLER